MTAEEVAKRFRDCLLAADAACCASLMNDDDLRNNGMDEAKLRAFLLDWVRPKLKGKLVEGRSDVAGDGKSGFQLFTFYLAGPQGESQLDLIVAKTDEGLKVVNPLSYLVLREAGMTKDGSPAKGPDKLLQWANNLERLEPELKQYSFTAILSNAGAAPRTVRQFAAWCRERLEKRKLEGSLGSRAN